MGVTVLGFIMPVYIETIRPYANYILAIGISLIISPWILTLKDSLTNKKLQDSIQSRPLPQTNINRTKKINPMQESVLLSISNNRGSTASEIASMLSIGNEVALFHLQELESIEFARVAYLQGSEWEGIPYREEWSTNQLGRKYLIHHKLIK